MSRISNVTTTIQVGQPKIVGQTNVIGTEHKNAEEESGYSVELSMDGKLHNENNRKKSGITSARDTWEDSSRIIKKNSPLKGPYADYNEIMRLDEPETYDHFMKLREKRMNAISKTGDELSEEAKEYELESLHIFTDWFKRRCENKNGQLGESISNTIGRLEKQFSDSIHDVSFNMYGGNNAFAEDMWRFNSKFSVLISKNMLDTLKQPNSEGYKKLLSFIDDSVNNMKMAELKYEGDFEWLRFGVKLQDDWKATYYANFTGCKEPDGIQAESADELLQMLINYKK